MYFTLLLYALFGSVFTIGKQSLQYAQPFFIIGSRMTAAGMLLLAYMFLRDRKSFKFDAFSISRLFLLGLFNIFLTNTCEFWGLQYLTSGKTCLLYSISPFIAALLSYFILSEVMNARKWLGLTTGFIGFLPIILSHTDEEKLAGSLFIFSLPELAVLGAATFSVYGWILIRQLVNEKNLNPLIINGISMTIGGLMTLLHSYWIENWNPLPIFEGKEWGFIETTLAMLVISNFICYNLYGFLLKRYTATFMSFAGFSTPIFVVLFGWTFLGEAVPWQFWCSFVVVFLSLYIFHKEEIKSDFFYQTRNFKTKIETDKISISMD